MVVESRLHMNETLEKHELYSISMLKYRTLDKYPVKIVSGRPARHWRR